MYKTTLYLHTVKSPFLGIYQAKILVVKPGLLIFPFHHPVLHPFFGCAGYGVWHHPSELFWVNLPTTSTSTVWLFITTLMSL
jgi:hypothetical protein